MIRLLVLLSLLSSTPALAGEVSSTTAEKPLTVMLEDGLGTPSGLFGVAVQYQLAADWGLYLGGGLGVTGIQLGVLAHYGIGLGSRGIHSLVFGLGPSIGFRSESLGFHIEHQDDVEVGHDELFYTTWMNAELAYELRAHVGFTLRVVVGAGIRLADNQEALCKGAPTDDESECNGIHFAPGSRIARLPVLPYLGVSYGWSF